MQRQVTKDDLAAHVRERLEKEQAEKERARKEKEESHLYTIIKVARDSDLQAQIGRDKFFDLVDHDKVMPVPLPHLSCLRCKLQALSLAFCPLVSQVCSTSGLGSLRRCSPLCLTPAWSAGDISVYVRLSSMLMSFKVESSH